LILLRIIITAWLAGIFWLPKWHKLRRELFLIKKRRTQRDSTKKRS
jgi:hypothetical protein